MLFMRLVFPAMNLSASLRRHHIECLRRGAFKQSALGSRLSRIVRVAPETIPPCCSAKLATIALSVALVSTVPGLAAAVTLEPEGQGFRISRSALTLRAQVPNLDETKFVEMATDAEKNCPVSKVLNAAITLDAS